jgi:hypothetical protein
MKVAETRPFLFRANAGPKWGPQRRRFWMAAALAFALVACAGRTVDSPCTLTLAAPEHATYNQGVCTPPDAAQGALNAMLGFDGGRRLVVIADATVPRGEQVTLPHAGASLVYDDGQGLICDRWDGTINVRESAGGWSFAFAASCAEPDDPIQLYGTLYGRF